MSEICCPFMRQRIYGVQLALLWPGGLHGGLLLALDLLAIHL